MMLTSEASEGASGEPIKLGQIPFMNDGRIDARFTPDDRGAFTLTNLPAGEFHLILVTGTYVPGRPQPLVILKDKSGQKIRVKLTETDGADIGEVAVTLPAP